MADDPTTTGANEDEAESFVAIEPPAQTEAHVDLTGEVIGAGPVETTAQMPEDVDELKMTAEAKGGAQIMFGGERVTPQEAVRKLRGLPGGVVTEITKIPIQLRSELTFTVANNELRIQLKVKEKEGDADAVVWDARPAPLSAFGMGGELNAFLEDVKRNLAKALRPWLSNEIALLTADIVAACALLRGVTREDPEAIIRNHTRAAVESLNKMLEGVPKHTGGGWSKVALHQAVYLAAFRLAFHGYKPRALTLDAVNDELRTTFRDDAPASGEALRKQLAERGLNWSEIKASATRAARSAVEHAKRAEAEARQRPPFSGPEGESENGG